MIRALECSPVKRLSFARRFAKRRYALCRKHLAGFGGSGAVNIWRLFLAATRSISLDTAAGACIPLGNRGTGIIRNFCTGPDHMARTGGTAAALFALTLLAGGCAKTPEAAPEVLVLPPVSRTGVQPGDQVVIRFYTAAGFLHTEVSGERTVDGSGSLFLPFLGTVDVVGMGSEEVRTLLEDRYGTLYADPVVEVVTNVNVNITGAVGRPGQFFLPPSATLVDALAVAGGVTSEIGAIQGGASDPSRVRLVRDGVATVIDLRPLDVRPGDPGAQGAVR